MEFDGAENKQGGSDNMRDYSLNLERWRRLNSYRRWMYSSFADYIGDSIVEVGAGLGDMIPFYVRDVKSAMAVEVVPKQVKIIQERYGELANLQVKEMNILNDDIDPTLLGRFDTAVSVNVLEHIQDDTTFLEKMRCLVKRGGNIIIFVPAMHRLYCKYDVNAGHYKRYQKEDMQKLATAADLDIIVDKYFNFLGIFPYYIKGKMYRKGEKDELKSFSSTLNDTNSKLYNLGAKVLAPIERAIHPFCGLSEVTVFTRRD